MKNSTRDLLQKHFDTAFSAPDGIAKLRELILTRAMQGKLVDQDPKDPPASDLIKQIEAEQARLIKERKFRKPKSLPSIKPDEVPYELPKGWKWVRLGAIGTWKSGSTPSRSNRSFYGGGIPWVKSGEVKQGRIKSTEETITQEALDKCPLQLNEIGSVLVAMYGANIGEVGILEIEATTNQAVCACKPSKHINGAYLLLLITSLKTYFLNQGAGAAQPNISREKIVSTLFPLPPFPEQHRIVAKVDQLMAQCDELEKLKEERDSKRLATHAAAIKQLTSPSEASAKGGAFIQRHFHDLYTVKENVPELRKAILQLAVMGKLVPQDPNDPPASELLKQIEAEKARLVKDRKIKKPKPLPPIDPEDVPYKLPQGWEWVRLGELTSLITKGSSPRWQGIQYVESQDGILFITSENVGDYELLKLDEPKFVEARFNQIEPRSILKAGDILINLVGASIGRSAIFDLEEVANINQAVALTRLIEFHQSTCVVADYVLHFLHSETGMNGIMSSRVINAQPNISLKNINEFCIPIPPLPEQHRIVAKVDQLMVLCDELEFYIDASTAKQSSLLNAVMSQVA
jgi:type I restriction enzyme S subunit